MKERQPSEEAVRSIATAIGSLQALSADDLKAADGETLVALATLCAHWEVLVGHELVSRHDVGRSHRF